MKNHLLLIVFLLVSSIAYSQEYEVTTMQSTYDTLTDYKSLTQELIEANEDPLEWVKVVPFGFEFPFFNEKFKSVIASNYGLLVFSGDYEVNVALYGAVGLIVDTTLTQESDVRYATVNDDNQQALVIEFHNVYHDGEFLSNGKTHHINLQQWFYEDGRIQIRFGDIDLDSCSYYKEGIGFLAEPGNFEEAFGPYIALLTDEDNLHCYSGSYEDGKLIYGDPECGQLSTTPPSGSIIQFKYVADTTSVQNHFYNKNEDNQYTVISEGSTLKIQGELSNYSHANIYDTMGRLIQSSSDSIIDLDSNLSTQIVIVQLIGKNHQETHKVLVTR